MARDKAYREAEKKIEEARRSGAKELDLSYMGLTELPDSVGQLARLQDLRIPGNKFAEPVEFIGKLTQLKTLHLSDEALTSFPEYISNLVKLRYLAIYSSSLAAIPDWLGKLTQLRYLWLAGNKLTALPDSLSNLSNLAFLALHHNRLTDLPPSLVQLEDLETLDLRHNPLNPELAAAYEEGFDAVKAYLRAKAEAQITLNEAKLILVGEGAVGKTCLMDALQGVPWQEHDTTHGIDIRSVQLVDPESGKEIILNGWDFGGQRVYRPTHQFFFSAPALYLVVWKPREGPQQGFVKEWIKLVKHREPDAKILVVATHGGPQQRQPHIDRQELWDLFGKDTVLDFFHVDSKPDENGERRGIEELKRATARVAVTLAGYTVPAKWVEARRALQRTGAAYLSWNQVIEILREYQIPDTLAPLLAAWCHRLGHLIYYAHDPALRDLVVLKPDWLATASSFVLDDQETRKGHGLVHFSRLRKLWNDPTRAAELRYAASLHPVFLRLMERFDLSYRVAGLASKDASDPASLIAQLVPDTRPEKDLEREWPPDAAAGDIQQAQICRIVDQKGQSATAEGLFYQLTVRLHKYSLGRVNFEKSVHWQRGLVLDDDYNGRALLEHVSNDVHITVRAPYPERFLAMLTSEVKYLVESFWEGLRCDVMVPCVAPCGKEAPGTGLFEVEKLIAFKRQGLTMFPCMVSGCNQAQTIDSLLRNAPAIRPVAAEELFGSYAEVKRELTAVRRLLVEHDDKAVGRFDRLDISTQRILSRVDDAFDNLVKVFTDEAKEGPRLFSLVPVDRKKFNPKEWTSEKFRLTLWCEHSRLPLPALNGKDSKKGVYDIELTRQWFKKAAPVLKVITGTLSLVLPVASSGIKLALDDKAYEAIEERLDFGKDIIDASLSGSEKISDWLGGKDATSLQQSEVIRAHGATLRELHALLKAKDPGFGGLVRVMNKRQEFLWVHPQFEKEY